MSLVSKEKKTLSKDFDFEKKRTLGTMLGTLADACSFRAQITEPE